MKFSKSSLLFFRGQSCTLLFLKDKEIFSFLNKIFIKIVIFGHFRYGSNIFRKYFILFSNLTDNMSNLIDYIPICNDANNLNNHNDNNLWDINRRNISITDCEHSCKGKIQRVNIFFCRIKIL